MEISLKEVAQILSVLGMGTSLFALSRKESLHLKGVACVGGLIWTISFACLGKAGLSATLVSMVITGKQFLSFWTVRTDNRLPAWTNNVFYALACLILLCTYTSWTSILPCMAMCILFFAYDQDNMTMRKLLIGADILWIVYNITLPLYGAIITSLLMVIMNFVTIKKMSKLESDPSGVALAAGNIK